MNSPPATPADEFAPTAAWATLWLRARLLKQLRDFFDARGFLAVETPLLSAETVVDRYLDPIPVPWPAGSGPARAESRLWLQTSPEAGMKRLLAAGAPSIYQITRAFRDGERGPLHNPEFTLLEWYAIDQDMPAGMQLLSELAEQLLGTGPAERLSYRDAFLRHVQLDPHTAAIPELAAAARRHGLVAWTAAADTDRDGWLNLLLAHCVEPWLGRDGATIVYDYPASQAALACHRRDGDVTVAERFELYVRGVELANGYHELRDASELEDRWQQANAQRQSAGKPGLPSHPRLLAALRHGLPPCTGVALGVDRLVMLAARAERLDDVLTFPVDRA